MDGQRKGPLLRELAGADINRYCVEVHALKSASANIGAVEVSQMAREQEEAASRGDTALIQERFPALLEAYEALLEEISRFLAQHRQAEPQGAQLPALPMEELREQVGAALEELENFRSQECAEQVAALLRHQLPQETEDSLREIQGQLKLFEDDNAEALFRQLLSKLEKETGSQ